VSQLRLEPIHLELLGRMPFQNHERWIGPDHRRALAQIERFDLATRHANVWRRTAAGSRAYDASFT
jgi:hypothetical protein